MIIKKNDNNSIFPIIIKIIKLIFEVVNMLEKLILVIPKSSESTVLVNVKIDNLNELSKLILSAKRNPDKKNKLIKKEIKIKKELFRLSLLMIFSEYKIFWLNTLFGLTNCKISKDVLFKSI